LEDGGAKNGQELARVALVDCIANKLVMFFNVESRSSGWVGDPQGALGSPNGYPFVTGASQAGGLGLHSSIWYALSNS
jgi:hypothetical protein